MILDLDLLHALVQWCRSCRMKIVMTGGIYDLLHVGHLDHLEEAKAYGDVLIVEMGDDQMARLAKGEGQVLIPENERARLVNALKPVDHVILVRSPEMKWAVIEAAKPDFYVRGVDYTLETAPERGMVERLGGRMVFSTAPKKRSSRDLRDGITT